MVVALLVASKVVHWPYSPRRCPRWWPWAAGVGGAAGGVVSIVVARAVPAPPGRTAVPTPSAIAALRIMTGSLRDVAAGLGLPPPWRSSVRDRPAPRQGEVLAGMSFLCARVAGQRLTGGRPTRRPRSRRASAGRAGPRRRP